MSTASSGQQATDSLNGKLTFEQDKNRIVGRDENNLIRLLILANGIDFVMKVAKEGFDALTAQNDELIFNSAQNVFKIVDTNTVSIATHTLTTGASQYGIGQSSATYAHNLGYIPAVLAFRSNGSSYTPIPDGNVYNTVSAGAFSNSNMNYSIDSTNLYIFLNSFGYNLPGGQTITGGTVKFFLMQETAN